MFQEGPIAQAASDVAQAGVAYFCAAGNQKNEAWEGEFKSTTCTFKSTTGEFTCHDFGNGNFKQRINVAYDTALYFQWDEPTRFDNVGIGPSSDINILFLDVNTGDIIGVLNDDNFESGAPFEAGFIPAGEYDLVIDLSSGPGPTSMKWIHVNRGIQFANPQLNGSWLIPQGNTAFTAAIGAANDVQKFGELNIEPFSSSGGGSPIVFDRDGTRFHVPKIFHQPRVVGPDVSVISNNDHGRIDDQKCFALHFISYSFPLLFLNVMVHLSTTRGKIFIFENPSCRIDRLIQPFKLSLAFYSSSNTLIVDSFPINV